MTIGHNSAVRATFEDVKRVKTRKCWQLIFEVPEEAYDAAIATLGGSPQSGTDRWVGIAPIKAPEAPAETERPDVDARRHHITRPWSELSPTQQAGIACNDPAFQRWICLKNGNAPSEECAARMVRTICGVKSRSNLGLYPGAATAWGRLYEEFKAHKRHAAEADLMEQRR